MMWLHSTSVHACSWDNHSKVELTICILLCVDCIHRSVLHTFASEVSTLYDFVCMKPVFN